jgi:hypothetical protein
MEREHKVEEEERYQIVEKEGTKRASGRQRLCLPLLPILLRRSSPRDRAFFVVVALEG